MEYPLNKGDRVRCVDNGNATDYLVEGQLYDVVEVHHSKHVLVAAAQNHEMFNAYGIARQIAAGQRIDYFAQHRFEKV